MMAWVWHWTPETSFPPAEFDFNSPVDEIAALSDTLLDDSRGYPVFRTGSKLAHFETLHCPPVGIYPVVDDVWRKIVLQYVPSSLVQFYPVTLVARDGTTRKFAWVVPFSRVRCIDPTRSDVTIKKEKPNITLIFHCNYFVHHDHCLGDLHLARDQQMPSHMVLSDSLQEALAATGESSMFYRPENLPTLGRRQVH
jgi:hypothetical protein